MSNAKWRRLFTCFGEANFGEIVSEWKHIDSDALTAHRNLPTEKDIGVLGKYFSDGRFQPYEFKWIEWIKIPRTYFNERYRRTYVQDLPGIIHAIEQCGGIDYSRDEQEVVIFGYKR